MIGMTLFAAAYMAENVRGGLQAIPKGQYEAAQALGLGHVMCGEENGDAFVGSERGEVLADGPST